MIKVGDDDITTNHYLYINSYKTSASASFLEDKFIEKSFPKIEQLYKREYPYDILLPKSLDEMVKGDFSPERIIRITEPIKGLYSNIWFGDSSNGVFLRGGYIDGDSRKVCRQKLDDADIHMVLGGSTGQGKSVTLNALIFGLCLEYAPWEIALTLCDAKIVEFKSYALQTPMPHIKNIAATGDVDYLLSVLESLNTEMMRLNSVFTKAGVKNIKDFRKKTGLCLPQNIIVIDEFQTLFKMAGKKKNKVESILDSFARLGRNTGYHLLLASQELGSEISGSTLANIKVRAAVGCTGAISEKILGNDGAKNNFGKKGYLLFNTNSEGHSKAENVLVRVPYMPDNQRLQIGEQIIATGDLFKYHRPLSFYDEEKTVEESEHLKYLKSFPLDNDSIILGEPSFVMEDDEKLVRLHFDRKDVENICVLTSGNKNVHRYFSMLRDNMQIHNRKEQHIVIAADSVYSEDCNAKTIATPRMYTDSKIFESDMMNIAFSLIDRRKLCLQIDKVIFGGGTTYDAAFDKIFYSRFEKGSKFDTELNKLRSYVFDGLLKSDVNVHNMFPAERLKDDNYILEEINVILETFEIYNSISSQLKVEDMPPIFVWILGANKIIGLGRDSKSSNVTKLKKAMQDCTQLNIRFIVFTPTMEDIEDLLSGIRWFIIDSVQQREITKIKAQEDFPEQVAGVLGVLYDTLSADVSHKCVKFKKMVLDGELIV